MFSPKKVARGIGLARAEQGGQRSCVTVSTAGTRASRRLQALVFALAIIALDMQSLYLDRDCIVALR